MFAVKRHCFNYVCKLSYIKNNYTVKYISTPATSASSDTIFKTNGAKSLDPYTPVQDYYAGKSIFITGGTGFLGKVLLEKLLNTCTKIDKVYLLIRDKNGQPMSHRLEYDIFKNPLFERLKEHSPGTLKKVIPISGDITEPNLALKNDDFKTLSGKVSVVFHVAASVRFKESLGDNLKSNLEGTRELLNLCQRMNKLEVLVHVSTAYAIAKDIGSNVIEEKLYPAPAEMEDVYNFVKKYNNDIQKTQEFIGGLANTYTYTKALAEAYIAKHHGNIPICIVRPSAVGPKIDEPLIGWLDKWYGVTRLLHNVAIGINHIVNGQRDYIVDFIPVDYTVNTCLVAAAKHNRSKDIQVYNSCSSEANPVTWREVQMLFNEDTVKHGRNEFPFPFPLFIKSKLTATVLTFILEDIPAYCADFYLIIRGKTPRYLKTQDRAIRVRDSLKFYTLNTWVMKSGNVRSLYSSLSEHDRRLFPCDPAEIDWKKYIRVFSQGVNKYLVQKK